MVDLFSDIPPNVILILQVASMYTLNSNLRSQLPRFPPLPASCSLKGSATSITRREIAASLLVGWPESRDEHMFLVISLRDKFVTLC